MDDIDLNKKIRRLRPGQRSVKGATSTLLAAGCG
jgi:hypothetical protein